MATRSVNKLLTDEEVFGTSNGLLSDEDVGLLSDEEVFGDVEIEPEYAFQTREKPEGAFSKAWKNRPRAGGVTDIFDIVGGAGDLASSMKEVIPGAVTPESPQGDIGDFARLGRNIARIPIETISDVSQIIEGLQTDPVGTAASLITFPYIYATDVMMPALTVPGTDLTPALSADPAVFWYLNFGNEYEKEAARNIVAEAQRMIFERPQDPFFAVGMGKGQVGTTIGIGKMASRLSRRTAGQRMAARVNPDVAATEEVMGEKGRGGELEGGMQVEADLAAKVKPVEAGGGEAAKAGGILQAQEVKPIPVIPQGEVARPPVKPVAKPKTTALERETEILNELKDGSQTIESLVKPEDGGLFGMRLESLSSRKLIKETKGTGGKSIELTELGKAIVAKPAAAEPVKPAAPVKAEGKNKVNAITITEETGLGGATHPKIRWTPKQEKAIDAADKFIKDIRVQQALNYLGINKVHIQPINSMQNRGIDIEAGISRNDPTILRINADLPSEYITQYIGRDLVDKLARVIPSKIVDDWVHYLEESIKRDKYSNARVSEEEYNSSLERPRNTLARGLVEPDSEWNGLVNDFLFGEKQPVLSAAPAKPEVKPAVAEPTVPTGKPLTLTMDAKRQRMTVPNEQVETAKAAGLDVLEKGKTKTEMGDVDKYEDPYKDVELNPDHYNSGSKTGEEGFVSAGKEPTEVSRQQLLKKKINNTLDNLSTPGFNEALKRGNEPPVKPSRRITWEGIVKGVDEFFGLREKFGDPSGLPNEPAFAMVKDIFRTTKDMAKAVADERSARLIRLIEKLDETELRVVAYYFQVADALRTAKESKAVYETPKDIPIEEIARTLSDDMSTMESVVLGTDKTKACVEMLKEMKKEAANELVDLGLIDAKYRDTWDYFMHIVVDFQDKYGKWQGISRRLKKAYRGYTFERKGSYREVNKDFLEVELKTIRDIAYHNAQDVAVNTIKYEYAVNFKGGKNYNPKLKAGDIDPLTGRVIVEYQEQRGYNMFRGLTLKGEEIIDAIREMQNDPEVAQEIGITVDNVREMLMVGRKKTPILIDEPIANLMADWKRGSDYPTTGLGATSRYIYTHWKLWTLFQNPIRYNVRNLLGDAERVFASRGHYPFKKIIPSIEHLWRQGELYKVATQYGGVGTGKMSTAEIGDFLKEMKERGLKPPNTASEVKAYIKELSKYVLKHPFKSIAKGTLFRENLLRMSVFLDALEQVKKGNYSHYAGNHLDIKALAESGGKMIEGYTEGQCRAAAKIARETCGDYGGLTHFESKLRDSLIPFYSWTKINTSFWAHTYTAPFRERRIGSKTVTLPSISGRTTITIAPTALRTTARFGLLMARINTAYAAMAAWNNTGDRKKFEDGMPSRQRALPHLNIVIDGKLTARIGSPSALSDIGQIFGYSELIDAYGLWREYEELERGTVSFKDFAGKAALVIAEAPVRTVIQQCNPFLKVLLRGTTGFSAFPNWYNNYDAFTTKAWLESINEVAPAEIRKFARYFWESEIGLEMQDMLGEDYKKFLKHNNYEQTLGEALARYFTGQIYEPMDADKMAEQINKSIMKMSKRGTLGDIPRKGKERPVQILQSRLRSLNQ